MQKLLFSAMLGMEESDHEDFEPSPVQPASAETSRTPSTTARNVVAGNNAVNLFAQ